MNTFASKLTCLGAGFQTVNGSFSFCQAAAALKDLYKKHPVLYNSSIVCSFEPKVIYRVRGR